MLRFRLLLSTMVVRGAARSGAVQCHILATTASSHPRLILYGAHVFSCYPPPSACTTAMLHPKFGFGCSHTTRARREGEEEGVHYHFTSLESMRAAVAKGDFIEHAEVRCVLALVHLLVPYQHGVSD